MALTVLALNIPTSGVGAASDAHLLDAEKSFVLDGTLADQEQLVIEATQDPTGVAGWNGVVAWTNNNPGDITFSHVAYWYRVRRFPGAVASAPTASVSSTTSGANTFFSLPVVAGGATGAGAGVDVSAGGNTMSISIDGNLGPNESVVVQGSNDNTSWNGLRSFSNNYPGPNFLKTQYKYLRTVRVNLQGTPGGTVQILIGTAAAGGGGGGGTVAAVHAGTAITVTGTATDPIINNVGVTSNVAGAGISVSGATGAVTITNTGVTSAVAGTGIGVSGATGAVTFTNTGVTSIVAGTNITISGATGAVTINATGGGGGSVNSVNAGTGITISGPATDPIVTSQLRVGVAGGQTAIGGTLTTQNLTLRPNAADTTTGRVIVQGLGIQVPDGTAANPSLRATTDATGFYRDPNNGVANFGVAVNGARLATISPNGVMDLWSVNSAYEILNDIGTHAYGAMFVNAGSNLAFRSTTTEFMEAPPGGQVHFYNLAAVSWSSGAVVTPTGGIVAEYAITPPSQAAAAGTKLNAYSYDAVTATFTGGTNITTATGLNLINIAAPTYTNASAMNVAFSATLAISGAPIAGGSLILSVDNYSIWCQAGTARFDGKVLTSTVQARTGTLTLEDSAVSSVWTLSNTSALLLAPSIFIGGTSGSVAGDTFITPATGGAGASVAIFGTVSQFLKIQIPIQLSTANVTPTNLAATGLIANGPTGISANPVEWAILSTPGGNRAYPLWSMP